AVGSDGGDEGRFRQRGQDHPGAATDLQQDAAGGDHPGTERNRWRSGGGLADVSNDRTRLRKAMKEGTIVQCIGAVVDVEFPRGQIPEIYDGLARGESGRTLRA